MKKTKQFADCECVCIYCKYVDSSVKLWLHVQFLHAKIAHVTIALREPYDVVHNMINLSIIETISYKQDILTTFFLIDIFAVKGPSHLLLHFLFTRTEIENLELLFFDPRCSVPLELKRVQGMKKINCVGRLHVRVIRGKAIIKR